MKIKCVIVDDEPLALQLMENYASKVPFIELLSTFTNSKEALKFIENEPVDLLFLDIHMPDVNGIDLLKGIDKNTMAVFCTAYPDFALQGYELRVIDYLLKPFSFERFMKAAFMAHEQFALKKASAKKQTHELESEFIFVKSEYSLVKINVADIILMEGLKDYIKIFMVNNPKAILTLQSLRALEEKLPSNSFCRIHKSFIINLKYLQSVQKNSVNINNREIPIGNQFKDAFISIIERNTPK